MARLESQHGKKYRQAVALLEKDRVRNGEIFLRTAKNGKPVKLPVHPDLSAALDLVPHRERPPVSVDISFGAATDPRAR